MFCLPRWVFIYEKGYQSTDTAVSSVYTKMKGVGYTNRSGLEQIWDVADYVFPSQVRMQCVCAAFESTSTSEGLVMVPRRRNAMTTQTLRRSREPVLVLRRVLVSGPNTAPSAALSRCKVKIFWRRTFRILLAGDARRIRNPLAFRRRVTITMPYVGCQFNVRAHDEIKHDRQSP